MNADVVLWWIGCIIAVGLGSLAAAGLFFFAAAFFAGGVVRSYRYFHAVRMIRRWERAVARRRRSERLERWEQVRGVIGEIVAMSASQKR